MKYISIPAAILAVFTVTASFAGDITATIETGEVFAVEDSGKTEILRVQDDGKVGIMNSSPGTALDVTGTVSADQFSGGGSGVTGVDADRLDGHDGSEYILADAGVEVITKVVRGTVSMGDTETEKSDTLSSSVTPEKCTVTLRAISADNNVSAERAVIVKTLTSTSITLQKTYGNDTALVAAYEVREYQ